MKRSIIEIDNDKCNGCGVCVPDCPEGALQIIDGKARLVSDLFCDGLGACISTCPEDAINIVEREAEPYDERKVMENVVPHGANTIKAHLKHLNDHGEMNFLNIALDYLAEKNIPVPEYKEENCGHGCPGSQEVEIKKQPAHDGPVGSVPSELSQWPVQLKLINPMAQYFDNADLVIAADCVAFSFGNFHQRFLKDKKLVVFCPKLDPYVDEYVDKLALLFKEHAIKSITAVRMEVPCCGGVNVILDRAMEKAGKMIPVREYVISIGGEII